MTNEYIHYEDLVRRNKKLDELSRQGLIIIPKRKLKTIGYIFIGVGILSIPIPLITIPLLLIGFTFLGLSYQELFEKLRRKFKLMLYKLR